VGIPRFKNVQFRLDDVLGDVEALLSSRAHEKHLTINIRASTRIPAVLVGDDRCLSLVLILLGSVALDLTSEGETDIEVDGTAADCDFPILCFKVGGRRLRVSDAARESIDGRLRSAKSAALEGSRQVDLRLAVSQVLVGAVGGAVDLSESPGGGGYFQFTAAFQPGKSGAETGARHRLNARILIADRSATIRKLLVEMSRSFGLKAASAKGGDEALLAIRTSEASGAPIDILLLDASTPVAETIHCVRMLLRGNYAAPPALILMVSVDATELRMALEAAKLRVDRVLTKPVTSGALFEACTQFAIRPKRRTSRRSPKPESGQLDGVRILLVEDNLLNQEIALELLRQAGANVTLAENGRQAIELLKRYEFDAVLMDCQMPIMDGFEATRQIRREARWAGLPILAMTANTLDGDREKVLSAGMNDYIAKPIDVEKMFETIGNWVKARPRDSGGAPVQ
jgi:CheY-like chemotaxis protein